MVLPMYLLRIKKQSKLNHILNILEIKLNPDDFVFSSCYDFIFMDFWMVWTFSKNQKYIIASYWYSPET